LFIFCGSAIACHFCVNISKMLIRNTMTKNLYLVRHAKAEPQSAGLSDFDRQLNNTGIQEATKMGKLLSDLQIKPDLIVSSPASRTTTTAEILCDWLGYDASTIHFERLIFDAASIEKLLGIINGFSEEKQNIILVGHNPIISYLAEYLTGENVGDLPTGGTACIGWEIITWKEVLSRNGKLNWLKYP
jgi:phosphohistidine phosphatase